MHADGWCWVACSMSKIGCMHAGMCMSSKGVDMHMSADLQYCLAMAMHMAPRVAGITVHAALKLFPASKSGIRSGRLCNDLHVYSLP